MQLFGVDFTSAARRRKPITIAAGRLDDAGVLRVDDLHELNTLAAFEAWLTTPGPWTGGFDFPFGLPRALLEALDWPRANWAAFVAHLATLSRTDMVVAFRAYCDARPAGHKFAHRATDLPAGSSPSMKWVNPPVAFMLHAGAPALLRAGVHLPGLHQGDPARVALEAYPGYLARRIVGRVSYKSDDPKRQTIERAVQRERILCALQEGRVEGMPVCRVSTRVAAALGVDPGADRLDAVLCLMQAGWSSQHEGQHFGLPDTVDPLEGWIISVPAPK